jgi:hypothetical protein
LWLRMSFQCRFANTKYVVLKYRVSETAFTTLLKQRRGAKRESRAWYSCIADQRHVLERGGAGHLWEDAGSRRLVLRELWPRFERSGRHETNLGQRGLKVARARLRSRGLRWRGVWLATRLCARYPIPVWRLLTRKQGGQVKYLTAQEAEKKLRFRSTSSGRDRVKS